VRAVLACRARPAAAERGPSPWAGWRDRHRARTTKRRQRRLDRQGLRRARRLQRRAGRRQRVARRWAQFRPYSFISAAAVAMTGACASLGVLFGAIFGAGVGLGVGLFAGLLAAAGCLVVLEWRVHG
jgi:hypothetical protein